MRDKHAIVWGASGGIGRALIDVLTVSGDYALIHAGSRKPLSSSSDIVRPFTFDLHDEGSIAIAAEPRRAPGG